MKSGCILLFALAFLSACHSPEYFAQKGDYDKAFELYASNISSRGKAQKNNKDLSGLVSVFGFAQSRDSAELALLGAADLDENWPRINKIHRQIQTRQQKLSALGPLRGKKGYLPVFTKVEAIDALEADSRRQAASYLYANAQRLLAITDSTGQRAPAREAYFALRDLKANYFPYWENANTLIDSAYREGKAHLLFETSALEGVPNGAAFWKSIPLTESYKQLEWLAFYTDSTARPEFDYRAKCRLIALHVGPESTSRTERIETKTVEDGFDEKLDSVGFVISRTPQYRTETTIITTYTASRSAKGAVLLELFDEHTGKMIHSQTIEGSHNASDSSEMFAVSAPGEWIMIGYVAGGIQNSIHRTLRKVLG